MGRDELFSTVGLEISPIDAENAFLVSRFSQRSKIVPLHISKLLELCGKQRSLPAHVDYISTQVNLSQAQSGALQRTLERLGEEGFLVSWNQIEEKLKAIEDHLPPPPPLNSVSIPTRNRLPLVKRIVQSFAENARPFGREISIAIFDDTPDEAGRSQARTELRQLAKEHRLKIRYATVDDKRRFAHKLHERTRVPAEIIDFAMFNPEGGPTTYGANRNSLLFDSAGSLFLMSDDDMVCKVAHPLEQSRGVGVSSQDPTDWWFFKDEEDTLKQCPAQNLDGLGCHSAVLGHSTLSTLFKFAGNEPVHLEAGIFQFLETLKSGQSVIRATVSGVFGDHGMATSNSYIGMKENSRLRLLQSEKDFRAYKESRQMMRVPSQLIIGNGLSRMTSQQWGVDARELLPPFMPVCRGEESVFASLLDMCFPNASAAFLPHAFYHSPMDRRRSSDQPPEGRGNYMYEVMDICLGLSTGKPTTLSPVESLRKVGARLKDLGRLPFKSFLELICSGFWDRVKSDIKHFSEMRVSHGNQPEFWDRDLEKYLATYREACNGSFEDVVPHDILREGEDDSLAMPRAQRVVYRFGELIEVWPEIMQGCMELNREGQRLSQEL